MNKIDSEIIDKLKKFNDLEIVFRKFTYESKTPVGSEEQSAFISEIIRMGYDAFNMKNDIALYIAQYDISTLSVNDESIRRLLVKLKNNGKFYSLSAYESLMPLLSEAECPVSPVEYLRYKVDELRDDFDSWFDIVHYYHRKCNIGAIIHSCQLPPFLDDYFNEMRNAYGFGLWMSTLSLCGAMLEMCLYDVLLSKGFIEKTNNPKIVLFEQRDKQIKDIYTSLLLSLAERKGIITEEERKLGLNVNWEANQILHIKDKEISLDESKVLQLVHDTTKIIERLYKK